MQRITISLEGSLASEFDRFVVVRGYSSRSEAVRDIIHTRLCEAGTRNACEARERHCVATLSYTYDGADERLVSRLHELRQRHQSTILSSLHIALEDHRYLETTFLRGPLNDVERCSNLLIGIPGIRDASAKFVTVHAPSATVSPLRPVEKDFMGKPQRSPQRSPLSRPASQGG
ncbi:nickel-responsive transcriptional regulator NikR [soil metagenome]